MRSRWGARMNARQGVLFAMTRSKSHCRREMFASANYEAAKILLQYPMLFRPPARLEFCTFWGRSTPAPGLKRSRPVKTRDRAWATRDRSPAMMKQACER